VAKILVIDDEALLRDDIADLLRVAGHQTLEAADGRQALDLILREAPDLVISDINMPVMDGKELLETLHARHPEHRTIPFLFLSAFAGRSDVIAGKKLGADDYLIKPVDHELVLETVNVRLRQAERFNEKKRTELAALAQAVLSALPHELRTPLNGVIGAAEVLGIEVEQGRASPKAGEYVAMILESGHRLSALVENVLELVAITTGHIAPQRIPVDLPKLVAECFTALRTQAEKARVRLLARVCSDLPLMRSDPRLLRRAFQELVGNAIKFSPADGDVTVSAEIDQDGDIKIKIVDTGPGIDTKLLPQLGVPFSKPHAGRLERADDGAGLGLSLTRAIVDLLDGKFSLASQAEGGLTAEIKLKIDAIALAV
jgi:signal transduction histidine kinase